MAIDDVDRATTFASYVPRAVLRRVGSGRVLPDSPAIVTSPAALLLVDITGFTELTAAAVARGPAATEALWRAINGYLGRRVDIVLEHGGDIAKIVGDALIATWPADAGDPRGATRLAAACASLLVDDRGDPEVEPGRRLAVKIGLCAGELAELHVGGLDGRYLFLIGGDAVGQMAGLGARMRTGQVVASAQAWAQLRDVVPGQPLDSGHVLIDARGLAVGAPRGQPEAGGTVPGPAVRGYVPRVSVARIEAGHGPWLAEVRRTSVVFAGIRGLAVAGPGALASFDRVARVGQEVVGRFDGWLKELTVDEKGTTMVAVFGVAPHSHEDDPGRAVAAAAALVEEIGRLGLEVGAGVATGRSICGPVGNERRRDFAVLGSAVNLAARLAEQAEPGVVLTDGATRDRVQDGRAFERLAAHVIKGMAAPIDVFRLSLGSEPGQAQVVGRRDELTIADGAVQALMAGTGGLVVIEGEPGIGKSTLVRAWLARAERAGARPLIGSAFEISASTPYEAWRPILEHLLDMSAVVDREARRSRFLAALGSDPDRLRMAPLLAPILAIDIADNADTDQLSGEVRADNTRDLLVQLLDDAARRRPLMVAVEDVHWLDSASWSMVDRVVHEIPSVLVVLTTRPGGADEQLAVLGETGPRVRLGPLSRDDALTLACLRAGATSIDEAVAAIVETRAGGNPLFVEQLTFAMRDAGRIVVQRGTVRSADGEAPESRIVPDTIQRVLTTRMDQLPPGEALTLKVASVVGERFELEPVLRVYPIGIDEASLRSHLATLVRLDLIAPRDGGTRDTFEFRHVIAREVAYDLMLPSQARELHGALARWYEATHAGDLAPYHGLLAHHWRRAEDHAKAIEHLELAAEQSLRTFANEEAIAGYREALELATAADLPIPPRTRARWHLGLGEALVNVSRFREGREHLELGLRLAGHSAPGSRVGQGVGLLRELVRQGLHRLGVGRAYRLDARSRADLVAALRAYERLAEASFLGAETLLPLYCVVRILNEAEKSAIAAEMARGYAGTGALFGLVPAARVARWYLDRATAHLEGVDDLTTHETVELVVGFYEAGVGAWDQARGHFGSVRGIAGRLGDRGRFDDALANLMELENLRGHFVEAADLARDLVASASARRDRRFEADGQVGLGYAAWHRGDAAVAGPALRRARQLIDELGDVTDELRIRALGQAAIASLADGDPTTALGVSDELLRLTEARPTNFGTFIGYAAPAQIYLELRESGHADRELAGRADRAIARLRAFAAVFPIGRPRAATLNGQRLWLAGDHDGARRAWERAISLATDLGMDYERALAHLELGRRPGPQTADRESHLAAAIETFERLGAGRALQLARAAESLGKPGTTGG